MSSRPSAARPHQRRHLAGDVGRPVVAAPQVLLAEQVERRQRHLGALGRKPDHDRRSAGPDHVPGLADGGRKPHHLERVVDTAGNQFQHRGNRVHGRSVDGVGRPLPYRPLELLRGAVDGDDAAGAGQPRARDHLQSDSAAADHAHASRPPAHRRCCEPPPRPLPRRSPAGQPATAAVAPTAGIAAGRRHHAPVGEARDEVEMLHRPPVTEAQARRAVQQRPPPGVVGSGGTQVKSPGPTGRAVAAGRHEAKDHRSPGEPRG